MHDFRLADARTKCHGLSQKMITLQEDGAQTLEFLLQLQREVKRKNFPVLVALIARQVKDQFEVEKQIHVRIHSLFNVLSLDKKKSGYVILS